MTGEDVNRHRPDDHEDDDAGVDLGIVRDYLSYVVRAVRRRRLLSFACSFFVLGLGGVAVFLMPRAYAVQTRILAQKNQIIAALGNPYRMLPSEVDAPTRAASETVKRHDNLRALIRQTNLIEEWPKRRAPLGRAMDGLRRFLRGPMTKEDMEDGLATMVQQKLTVYTGSEGTVTIALIWPEPETGYRIVQAAQDNFLENRHIMEISVIADSIALLEEHAAALREAVDATIADYRQKRARTKADAAAVPALPATIPIPDPALDPQVVALRSQILAKRNAVRDLEEYRNRRIAELQAQLAEQRAVFAESHPSVLNLRQSLDALSQESPGLVAARRDLEEAEADYTRRAGVPLLANTAAPVAVPLAPLEPVRFALDAPSKVEPSEEYARQRMNAAVGRYNTLLERVDSARMELDAARAAFKYRYVVVEPARRPKKPVAPNVPKLLVAVLAAAFFAGLAAAVAAEVAQGRVVQPWQIQRSLGVPVLAEFSGPKAAS